MHLAEASRPAHPQISESACYLNVCFVVVLSVHVLGQKKKKEKFKASKKYIK